MVVNGASADAELSARGWRAGPVEQRGREIATERERPPCGPIMSARACVIQWAARDSEVSWAELESAAQVGYPFPFFYFPFLLSFILNNFEFKFEF
jgi:hypothetical protein